MPRASDRTSVGILTTALLGRDRSPRRRHDSRINLRKEKNPRTSQHDRGWIAQRTTSLSPVAGEVFLLAVPFQPKKMNRQLCGMNAFTKTGSHLSSISLIVLRVLSSPIQGECSCL